MNSGLSYPQFGALTTLRLQCQIAGGWVYWRHDMDKNSLHTLIARGLINKRYTADHILQIMINRDGLAELRKAVVVYNGGLQSQSPSRPEGNPNTILSYVIDVILGTALLIAGVITICLLPTRDIETVMLAAPWVLIITLTMRVKTLSIRLGIAEIRLAKALRGKPTVINIRKMTEPGDGHV